MRLAILYATKYGATKRAAEAIARGCADAGIPESEIEVTEVGRRSAVPDAETIIIGAPVYAGSIPKPVKTFVETNEERLLEHRIRLFLSCLYGDSRAEKQLADNFPARLIAHSSGRYYVGGRIEFSKLSWLHRQVMKRVGGVDHDVDTFSDEEISRIVQDVTGGASG